MNDGLDQIPSAKRSLGPNRLPILAEWLNNERLRLGRQPQLRPLRRRKLPSRPEENRALGDGEVEAVDGEEKLAG